MFNLSWLYFICSLALLAALGATGYLIFAGMALFFDTESLRQQFLVPWGAISGIVDKSLNVVFSALIVFILTTGILVIAIVGSLIVVGLVRMAIFLCLGIFDQALSRESVMQAILGGITVSMVPDEYVNVKSIRSTNMLFHSTIHHDEEVRSEICSYIRRKTKPLTGLQNV